MLRVMVIFGGRSGEHEVSLASARAVMEALDGSERYEITPVGITREGRWVSGNDSLERLTHQLESDDGDHDQDGGGQAGRGSPASEVSAAPARELARERLPSDLGGVDVVFPVLHGPRGEDGTMQGLLELAGVPYVGSGVLASAVGMDKVTMKKVFDYHGLPQVDWLGLTSLQWESERDSLTDRIGTEIGYPCFVKPSNMGSSVGISKVGGPAELPEAIHAAAEFDRRIMVEAGVDAREIEVSVLGNEHPEVSLPGEIVVPEGFYDYENKYTEGASEIVAPADLPRSTVEEIQTVARTAYQAVDAAGMARVDFFLEQGTDRLFLNEINTIPGFTPTSVYARLWDASGLPYDDLLERLIQLALERHGG
ncbi:D-alanine--D-alanine ligase family protein [Rubrobacter aplysinae]|uniref:D-alanine--D-alanine ligase family protein n=1 Tax=Rubrobacter aplysinae TaxID=909625 RepID=UPI000AD4EF69|nr:D-alanine--D-alanine ligase family protein [Rubrobacter aplysinae]